MNKFYAILGTAILAAGSIATANAGKVHAPVQISVEGQARLNAAIAYANYEAKNGISDKNSFAKTSWSDGSKTWEATLINSGNLTDFFSISDASSAAYYSCWNVVLATVSQYDSTGSNGEEYTLALTYPNQSLWQYFYDNDAFSYTPAELFGDEYNADGLTPLSAWGTIFDTDEFYFYCPEADASGVYLGYFDDSWAMTIINSTCGSASSGYYYQYGSLGSCTVTKNGTETVGGTTVGTTLKISNYDADTQSIDLHFEGGATTTLNGTAFASFNVPYSGEFNNRGMIAGVVKNIEIGELHIINTGINNYDNNECYDVDWNEDLTRYYIMGCHPSLTFVDAAFTKDSYENKLNALIEDYTYQFFYGAVYSSADSENPYGIWKGQYINVEKSGNQYLTTNAPEANSFVYGGWNSTYAPFCSYDGLRLIDVDHYLFLDIDEDMADSEKPVIMNGTTEGFGIAGLNNYSEKTKVHFTGDVIYHYDSSDYTKTRTLATVGSLSTPDMWNSVSDGSGVQKVINDTVNATVTTDGGKVNITVANDAVVAIYNVAGQAVKSVKVAAGQTKSIELGSGLYIVKAGNKAVKVAL